MNWRNRIVGHGTEDPEQLLANPRNWRVHPKAQQDAMTGVLDEIGWITEVIVNVRTGFVVDGHLRVALAITKGEKSVPVTYIDVSEEEELIILATLDPIGSMIATDKEMLDELMKDIQTDNKQVQDLLDDIAKAEGLALGTIPAPKPQIDRADELQIKWQVENGQVWIIGKHRLMCGDSTSGEDVAILMNGKKASLLWADPPYHVGKKFGLYDEGKEWDQGFQDRWLRVVESVLDGNQRYICFGQAQIKNAILSYKPKRILIWCKPFVLMRANEWDWAYELIAWCVDGEKPDCFVKPKGTLSFDWHQIRSVIHGQDGKYHLTQKPIELPRLHIEASSPPGGSLIDPFMGSGTTMVAAEQLNRICYGMEIEPKYCAVTLERMSDMGLEPRLTK